MKSIFVNKELVKQEYQKLFLELVSDVSQLKKCIESRYNPGITELEIKEFFKKDDVSLKTYLAKDERVRYFFGSNDCPDQRDAQVTLLDRFILDSVNFHIFLSLIVRLREEYADNQIEIINQWLSQSDTLEIEPQHHVENKLPKCKPEFFADLIFPNDESVELFRLEEDRIIPNPKVFANWLAKSEPKAHWFKTKSAIAVGILGAVLGALCGLYFGILGVIIGVVIGVSLFAGVNIGFQYFSQFKATSNEPIINESHSLMNAMMPRGDVDAHLNVENPVINEDSVSNSSVPLYTQGLRCETMGSALNPRVPLPHGRGSVVRATICSVR